jgi:hypothetical protein
VPSQTLPSLQRGVIDEQHGKNAPRSRAIFADPDLAHDTYKPKTVRATQSRARPLLSTITSLSSVWSYTVTQIANLTETESES